MSRIWSPYQQGIFDWALRKDCCGHLVVEAVAGSGKSTTIREMAARVDRAGLAKRIMICAFNKRIAEDMTEGLRRAGARAESATLHSLGFRTVKSARPKVRPDDGRGKRLAQQAWGIVTGGAACAAPYPVVNAIAKLAGLAKNMTPRVTEAEVLEVCLGMGVEVEGKFADDYPPERLVDLARCACGLAKVDDGTVDFDDMLWLPLEHKWMRPTYDLLVVDEAQDMNRAQLELAQGLSAGRIVVVGDSRQAIYGWRGADSGAIRRMKDELGAQELPLSISYRCPKAVGAVARTLVPHFEVADTNIEGEVRTCKDDQLAAQAQAGDFILSRVNAPLAGICLELLRAGKPARIQGKDIGRSLVALIQRVDEPMIPALLGGLEEHLVLERERLSQTTTRGAAAKLEMLEDQIATIDVLSEGLASTEELVRRINSLFDDRGPAAIVCSSVHKAKGLEAPRVFILEWTLYCNGKRPDDPEESNIAYVAITRAQETLVMVQKGGAR